MKTEYRKHIPEGDMSRQKKEPLLASAWHGLCWLKQHSLILHLILFLAWINLIASIYNAVLPAMLLSKANGGEFVLGLVNAWVGVATLLGSLAVTVMPAPKNRVGAICLALLLSMSTENFLLAFGNGPVLWCIGAVMGWLSVPFMSANMDVIFRNSIPPDMQGRVYACRNSLQFFTIPLGFLAGGALIDTVFEPLMAGQPETGLLSSVFGSGKGSGAAFLFAIIGIFGVLICLGYTFILRRYRWSESD